MFFSSFLPWSQAAKVLATQCIKALYTIYEYNMKCNGLPIKAAFDLFDKMIMPIILYGAEIWGTGYFKQTESVQMRFCKRILGAPKNTSNDAVLGDCGRYPLALNYTLRSVKYWLKIINMPNTRYPKACYNMIYSLEQSGRQTWATSIKDSLMKYGYGLVWIQQGMANNAQFSA